MWLKSKSSQHLLFLIAAAAAGTLNSFADGAFVESVELSGPEEIAFGESQEFNVTVLGTFLNGVMLTVLENDGDEQPGDNSGTDGDAAGSEGHDLLNFGISGGFETFELSCSEDDGLCGASGCSGENENNIVFARAAPFSLIGGVPSAQSQPVLSNELRVECVDDSSEEFDFIDDIELEGPEELFFGQIATYNFTITGNFPDGAIVKILENDDTEPPGDNSGIDGDNPEGNDLLEFPFLSNGSATFELQCREGEGLCANRGCSGENENGLFLQVVLPDDDEESNPFFSNELEITCIEPELLGATLEGPSEIPYLSSGKFNFTVFGEFHEIIVSVVENDDGEPANGTGTNPNGSDVLIVLFPENGISTGEFELECVPDLCGSITINVQNGNTTTTIDFDCPEVHLCGPSGCSGEVTSNEVSVSATVPGFGGSVLSNQLMVKCIDDTTQANNTVGGDVTGDPHFKTWTGLRYDYHGACDLVLVQNPLFANGLGMHIHVRTKLQGTEGSYIQSVAVKIGNDILEVKADQSTRQRQLWLNGVAKPKGSPEEISISGFSISYRKEGHDLLVKKRHVYIIELSKTEHIIIKSFKHLLNVHFSNATNEHFRGSLGLLGSFDTGLKVGRDGKTVFEDDIRFGEEWQVLGTELMLFHEVDGPQHPGTCSYVNVVEKHEKLRQLRKLHGRGRRLSESISRDEAVEACSVVNEENRANCIFDVLSLSDLDMVALYMEDDTEASVFAH